MRHHVKRFFFVAAVVLVGQSATLADQKTHRQAAEALLTEMGVQKQMDASLTQMLDIQIKSSPNLAPAREAMREFFAKYVSWDSLKEEFVNIYCEAFTEADLKEILAFYKTTAGKKLIEKMPTITSKGMQLGATRVQEHTAELSQVITKALAQPKNEQK